MKRTGLFVLAVLALGLLLAALWLSSQRQPVTGGGHERLLPGLEALIAELDAVYISEAGPTRKVTLRKGERGWTVAERDDWPADVGQLRRWLLTLARARALEPKTRLAENYPVLGVADLDHPNSRGVLVEMVAGEERRVLIIGQNNPNGRGSYVRVPGEAQSWLADSDLAIERDPARWLARSLVSIPATEIVQVSLERAAGEDQEILRESEGEDASLILRPLPRGRKANETALYGVAGFLEGLRLEDVGRAEEATETEPELTAVFTRRDGLRVRVRLWPQPAAEDAGDGTAVTLPWATLEAEVDEDRAAAYHQAELDRDLRAREAASEPAPGAGDAEEADSTTAVGSGAGAEDAGAPTHDAGAEAPVADLDSRLAGTREEARLLDARFNGWRFRLPAFKLANLRRAPEDFLQPEN